MNTKEKSAIKKIPSITKIKLEYSNFQIYREHSEKLAETRGLFLADGEKVVDRLLNSSLEILEIICLEKYLTSEFLEKVSFHPEVQKIWLGSKEELKTIRGYELHQGIMALAKVPNLSEFPNFGPVLVCNNILEANNIGSLIRSAVALGINQMILDTKSCHPFIRRTVRVSVGNIFQMKFFRSSNLFLTLRKLQSQGYTIVGTVSNNVTDSRLISLNNFFPISKTAIVLGNEDSGIEKDILNLCNILINIPMQEEVDSLNVAVAGAIIMSRYLFQ
jgi:tRNA G18 (ribose-2'-O)-methylase SpoU